MTIEPVVFRASLTTLEEIMRRVLNEKGAVGSILSRISSAIATLQGGVEAYAAAEARITNVDVADEAAALARRQIAEQVSTAVLAQANQSPLIALDLLRGAGSVTL